ncbi:MAG: hypothetical protein WAQ08_09425 [Aquabacterium sp.]|uniref:hypothetical protein n=1 Tax=Aquabacterium sp. TaxID=1872578 RepID=UPI003BAFB51F
MSIRHSPPDADALLPWAREEVFSFVIYYKQGTSEPTCRAVGDWTRSLIDLALRHEAPLLPALPTVRHPCPVRPGLSRGRGPARSQAPA